MALGWSFAISSRVMALTFAWWRAQRASLRKLKKVFRNTMWRLAQLSLTFQRMQTRNSITILWKRCRTQISELRSSMLVWEDQDFLEMKLKHNNCRIKWISMFTMSALYCRNSTRDSKREACNLELYLLLALLAILSRQKRSYTVLLKHLKNIQLLQLTGSTRAPVSRSMSWLYSLVS